jgi:hypothetical protein
MGFSILTIPFQLKQQESSREFLHGPFGIDPLLDRFFGTDRQQKACGFLKIGKVHPSAIKRALARVFLRNLPGGPLADGALGYTAEAPANFFIGDSFFDKKYLRSVEDYAVYPSSNEQQAPKNGPLEKLFAKLTGAQALDKAEFTIGEGENQLSFVVDWIKFVFNRSRFNPGVGFGFITVKLVWEQTDRKLSKCLAPHADFFRFIHAPKSKFRLKHHWLQVPEHKLTVPALAEQSRKSVSVRACIRENSDRGEVLYEEVHSGVTAVQGQINSLIIGSGRATAGQYDPIGLAQQSVKVDFYVASDHGSDFELCGTQDLNLGSAKWNLWVQDMAAFPQNGSPGDPEITLSAFLAKDNDLQAKPVELHFEQLFMELLRELVGNRRLDDFFEIGPGETTPWGQHQKPHLLHVSVISRHLMEQKQHQDETWWEYPEDEFMDKRVYRLLRIPNKESPTLNPSPKFEAIVPDENIRFYCLQEGAFVFEGEAMGHASERTSYKKYAVLDNKYFPAFLMALNQRYLFHYFHGLANRLQVRNKSPEKLDPKHLRRLKGALVKAEFYQVFTAISHYNELETFFESLQDKFKIKELRSEFLESITSLQRIVELSEAKDEKKQETILNFLLAFLSITQVWPAIYEELTGYFGESPLLNIFTLLLYLLSLLLGFCILYGGAANFIRERWGSK